MTTMQDNFGHLVEPMSHTPTGDINYPRSQAISAKRTADAVEAIHAFLTSEPQITVSQQIMSAADAVGAIRDYLMPQPFAIEVGDGPAPTAVWPADFDPSTNQRPDGSVGKPRPGAEQRPMSEAEMFANVAGAGAEQRSPEMHVSYNLNGYTDRELYEELDRRSEKRRAETAEREKREAAIREEGQKRHQAFMRLRKALRDHASHRALFVGQPYHITLSYDDLELIVS